MPASPTESFRTLYCDPGEDFGWAIGKGTKLLAGGTEKMWAVADELHYVLDSESKGIKCDGMFAQGRIPDLRLEVDGRANTGPIKRIVAEDWRLYPDKLKDLKWDKCRTARVIGAITMLCRIYMIELVLQPAAIKDAAQKAGVEQLYYRPLRENRHANDAMQHYMYFVQTEMMGAQKVANLRGPASNSFLDGIPQL